MLPCPPEERFAIFFSYRLSAGLYVNDGRLEGVNGLSHTRMCPGDSPSSFIVLVDETGLTTVQCLADQSFIIIVTGDDGNLENGVTDLFEYSLQ